MSLPSGQISGSRPDRNCWIFGYGSLMWRPSFPFVTSVPATITGWSRRFWQGSTDHRGVPGAPGRVVTLVEEAGARCWGIAYEIAAADRTDVLAGLDWREKGGYERREEVALAQPQSPSWRVSHEGRELRVLVYVATPDNPNYLGPAPMASVASQVRTAHGPSGSNVEYVLRLAQALFEMGAEDRHVYDLASLLGWEGGKPHCY